MKKTMTKNETISKILHLTNRNTSEAFDLLIDKSEQYLGKFLKVVQKLANAV